MTSMDLKDSVREWIAAFISQYCDRTGIAPIWREPLVGLADAGSPLFSELRSIAHPGHKVPSDYLDDPVTVISYFLPFSEDVASDNETGDMPTPGWAEAYRVTNAMAAELNRFLADRLTEEGFRAAVPEDAGRIVDGTYSVWSQRHVARITGLGSFGMNNMLISEAGCCGRYFSVITDAPCEYDRPFTGERCLHRIDGSCGICMAACPLGALTDDGFIREVCAGRCSSNVLIVGSDVCGKCIVGMPCTFTDPSRRAVDLLGVESKYNRRDGGSGGIPCQDI